MSSSSSSSLSTVEHNRHQNRLFSGRDVCDRCRRPRLGCYCARITPVETRTRLVLLQHPRERYVAIGTALMASLCVKGSELHVGIDWSRSNPLARALSDPTRTPILLYPGEGAIDITREPPSGPVTLVVVDGTWAQTKKVVRMNPILAALPRYAFVPPRPSEYRIRKEPDEASVATIEAVVHALAALEGRDDDGTAAERFSTLLTPFRAMIDFQVECQERFRGARSRHTKRKARVRRMRVPRLLTARPNDIVCVAAEASSWPYAMRTDSKHQDELVHWAAQRVSTGETLSLFAAPRNVIAPWTTEHTGIDEATLRSAGTFEELHAKWRAFIRDTDVVCSWGSYEPKLFVQSGGWLPTLPRGAQLDLRHVARDVHRGTVGSLSHFHERVRTAPQDQNQHQEHPVMGRAGRKLHAMLDVIAAFSALASSESASESE